MVDTATLIFNERRKNKLGKRAANIKLKKNIRIQLFTDIDQFAKIQNFLSEQDNIFDCDNESQAAYKIINNYFDLLSDLEKWKNIAQSTIESKIQLEHKLKEKVEPKEKEVLDGE